MKPERKIDHGHGPIDGREMYVTRWRTRSVVLFVFEKTLLECEDRDMEFGPRGKEAGLFFNCDYDTNGGLKGYC